MLEQLFGSRTRILLLRLFLEHPDRAYFVRELTRLVRAQVYSVRRELDNLVRFHVIAMVPAPVVSSETSKASTPKKRSIGSDHEADGQKKYYALNKNFILYPELKALFLKSRLLIEKELVAALEHIGRIQFLVLTGLFVGESDAPTDIFLVGSMNRAELKSVIEHFEQELQHPINYTIFTKPEFTYRREITDRFLFTILEHKKIVVIDKLGEQTQHV